MKDRAIKIILVISLITNLALILFIKGIDEEIYLTNRSNLSEAYSNIFESLNICSNVNYKWKELTDKELIVKFSDIERELYSSMHLMNSVYYFFEPVKKLSQDFSHFSFLIIRDGKNETLFQQSVAKCQELRVLDEFITKYGFDNLEIEELRLKWNELVTDKLN